MSTRSFRVLAILLGLLLCGGASFGIWRLWTQPAGDSWTPAMYAPQLDTVKERVEVFVAGEPLLKAATDQKLTMTVDGNATPVTPSQLTVRLNNQDRDKVAKTRLLLYLAGAAGAGLFLFLVGLITPLIGAFHQKGPIDPHFEEI